MSSTSGSAPTRAPDAGLYDARHYCEHDAEMKQRWTRKEEESYRPRTVLFRPPCAASAGICHAFRAGRLASYVRCQEEAAAAYFDDSRWTRMPIFNVARSGKFSSDRAIRRNMRKRYRAFHR
ncbi:MAG: glycogen/starch/alpha-glucan phosphorylase [Acidobacteriota bacterium]